MTNTYREGTWQDDSQKSSDEIKADIERTRNKMSEKLDTIQERLSPDNLKQQAQTMVQDVVKDSTDAITDYVSHTLPEVSDTVVDLVRRNPIPAALIGVGVGWLLMRSMQHDDHDDYRTRSRYSQSRYYPQEQYSDPYRTQSYPSDAMYYTGNYARFGDQREQRPSSAEMDYANEYGRRDLDKMRQQYQGEKLNNGGNGHGITDKVRNAVSDVSDQVSSAASSVSEQVSSAASSVTERASNFMDQASNAGSSVRHQANRLGSHAQDTGMYVQQTIEESPLAFGAVALAVGVMIGMALPATRRENEWLGETRDRVMESAQEAASEVASRVQHVANEVAPKVEEAAKKVVDEVKQSTKTAATDVVGSVKSATQDLQNELKQKAEDEAQKTNETSKPNTFSAD